MFMLCYGTLRTMLLCYNNCLLCYVIFVHHVDVNVMLFYATVTACYIMLCCVCYVLCYSMSCYVMLYYVLLMLCYVMSCYEKARIDIPDPNCYERLSIGKSRTRHCFVNIM